ncbi:hypothetical protein B0H10DRAFT_2233665 [Mycena sp. CBHHK59/15]|nr:hypothetical protein B0H10DRAFT_2233665 [Mycena sp. CBHHK59/15]
MLLHYNYGAAAVKWWGHSANSHLGISNRPTMPRASVPVPAATGPIRTKRTPAQLDASIQKRATGNMGESGSGHRDREAAQEGEVMDPDEIVMFFWSRTPPHSSVESTKQKIENARRKSVLPAWNSGERVPCSQAAHGERDGRPPGSRASSGKIRKRQKSNRCAMFAPKQEPFLT